MQSERIERLAEYLCSEFDFSLNPCVGYSWPEHENDDGYRGAGSFVKLQPSDVQAYARENAKRILAFLEREAALSAAGPVATVAEMGAGGMRVLMPHPPGSADHLPIGTKLYAAPPAPSVAVKALPELCPCGDVMRGGRCQCGSISTAEPRIPSAEQERLRFEGDLDKWMKILGAGITGYQPEAYAVMDAACAELVKMRTLSAQVQGVAGDEEWQTVPKHPTGRMIDAVVSMVDGDAPHPFILNLYRSMLAEAPAKQEGCE